MRKFLVPESVWHLQVAELPGPARLHPALKAVGVRTLRDLHGRRLSELRQQKNCGAVTIAALEQLLQRAVSGEFDGLPVEERNAFEALLNLIEAAIQRLQGDDRRVLLGRLGVARSPPRTLEQLATPRGLTRQGVRHIIQTLFTEIRQTFGARVPRLLDQVKEYCISNVCPLTPQLLEQLAPGFQSQFRLSPEAQARIIGALDEHIPCWPNRNHRYNRPDADSRGLAAHVARIAWRTRGPVTLAEAYRQLKTQRRHRSLTVPEYLRRVRNGRRIRIQFDNPQQPTIRNLRRLIHRHRSSAGGQKHT